MHSLLAIFNICRPFISFTIKQRLTLHWKLLWAENLPLTEVVPETLFPQPSLISEGSNAHKMESPVCFVSVNSMLLHMAHLLESYVSLRHYNHHSVLINIGSFVGQVISRLQQRVQCPSPNDSTVCVIWLFIFNLKKGNYRQLHM